MKPLEHESRPVAVAAVLPGTVAERGRRLRWAGWLAGLVLIYLVPTLLGPGNYLQYTADQVAIFALVAIGLNLLVGYNGQISIGHSAFVAVGAYTSVLLQLHAHVPFWLAVPIGGVAAGLLGLLVGFPAVRLRGHYLAVMTLGLVAALPEVLVSWTSVTNGWTGLTSPTPTLFGMPVGSNSAMYYVIVTVLIVMTWLAANILRSRSGRAMMAVRDSQHAALAMGINVNYVKTLTFALSALYAGVAGGLFAAQVGFINPNNFDVSQSFLYLVMIVVGGLASLPGSIIGAAIFVVLQPLTSSLQGLQQVIIGIIMVVMILFAPQGLMQLRQAIVRIVRRRTRATTA
jgi:branched-chain amino acid transport system permease protein